MNLLNTNFEEQKIGVRRLNLNNGHEHLIQSWMTIKKTEISAQHKFLKPIYLCLHRGIVLIYLDVHQKC